MLGAKDAGNSKSRSASFETLNILKEQIFISAVVGSSECVTFRKDMR